MPYRYFEDPYVYGPVTKEEFDALTIHHRMTYMNNEMYIGVSQEIPEFESRRINRPDPVVEEQTPTQ